MKDEFPTVPVVLCRRTRLLTLFLLLSAFLTLRPLAETVSTAPSGERFVSGEAMFISVPLDKEAFLNGGYPIDSAGFVDLPVLGRLEVAGRNRETVEEYIALKLSNYLKDTHVRVIPSIRLTLLGNWQKQGQYYVSPAMTVWEAVLNAGGIAGERNLDEVTVMRGNRTLDIVLMEEYSKGRTLAAAGIRSGDIFVIPVPRENVGAWYWFKEGLTVTAQIAAIVGTVVTAYITYTILDRE